MSRTPTAGITVDRNGRRTINKEYRGVRVFLRLGAVCQEHAERRLAQEIDRLEWEVERRAHARPLFSDCCNRFLAESKYKRTKDTIAWHVAMLLPMWATSMFAKCTTRRCVRSSTRGSPRAKAT